jgi:hypothetical protein
LNKRFLQSIRPPFIFAMGNIDKMGPRIKPEKDKPGKKVV